MKTQALLAVIAIAAALYPREARSGEVSFDGNRGGGAAWPGQELVARLGTFKPDFDPFRYKFVYGIDRVGNMASPNYSRAVSDGNFRPIGEGSFIDLQFSGVGSASAIEGQQLWIFLFNSPNPDAADLFALFTGTGDSWRAPPDTAASHIFADSADVFVFGSGGRGAPIELQVLPVPEPSSMVLLVSGMALLCTTAAGRCRRGLFRSPNQSLQWTAGCASVQVENSRPRRH